MWIIKDILRHWRPQLPPLALYSVPVAVSHPTFFFSLEQLLEPD